MSEQQSGEWSWRDVERVIEDLKRDGYQPEELKSNTSEARPKKSFLLRVERAGITGGSDE